MVTTTSLVPVVVDAGTVAVIEVVLATTTLVAATPPTVMVAPLTKPDPVIVTAVPPVTGPKLGEIEAAVMAPETILKALLVTAVTEVPVAVRV